MVDEVIEGFLHTKKCDEDCEEVFMAVVNLEYESVVVRERR